MSLNKISFIVLLLISTGSSLWSQRKNENFELRKTINQDGYVYQFYILDQDKNSLQKFDTNRVYFWYKTQKLITTQGGASGDLLHGTFEAFYENKQLAQKGQFRKGLKHGEWIFWKVDGTIDHVEKWKRGKIEEESKDDQVFKTGPFFKKLFTRDLKGKKNKNEKSKDEKMKNE